MAVPAPSAPFTLSALSAIMASLRNPDHGCPWDLQQDFSTIAPYTIEEAYEVADAIDRQDWSALRDELGDVLLQVVYHARMAEEQGLFTLTDVLDAICRKMIRRHPHVFGDAAVGSSAQQASAWEAMKAAERQFAHDRPVSALDGVARALPALMRAQKLQQRASRVGFDWPDPGGPLAKIEEEIGEVHQAIASDGDLAAEIGDLLFSVVNWARHLGVDAETALRAANRRFENRFAAVEALAGSVNLTDLSLDQLEAYWQQAKRLADQDCG